MEKQNYDRNITYIIENIIYKARYNEDIKQYEIKEKDYINLNLSCNQKRLLRDVCQNLGINLEYTDPTQIVLPCCEDEFLFEEYNRIKRLIDGNKGNLEELEKERIRIRNKIVIDNMMLIEAIIERRMEWVNEMLYREDIFQIGYQVLIEYIDENYLVLGEFRNNISKRVMPYINRYLLLQYGIIKLSLKNIKTLSRKNMDLLDFVKSPTVSICEEKEKIADDKFMGWKSLLFSDMFEDNMIDEIDKKNIVNKIIATLPKYEQEIIKLYFGFIGGRDYSVAEIANMYNVSRTRIFAVIAKTIDNIKNSVRIIYLSELYGVDVDYQFDKNVHDKLEIVLISGIKGELFDKILVNLNELEQKMLFLYLDNPEYNKLELSEIMNISMYNVTKIKNKLFVTIRMIITNYLQENENREITFEDYMKYLMKLYLNKKDGIVRKKRKD